MDQTERNGQLMSLDPCEQGIHCIECEGCKYCGRSWGEAMEHAKEMAEAERRLREDMGRHEEA